MFWLIFQILRYPYMDIDLLISAPASVDDAYRFQSVNSGSGSGGVRKSLKNGYAQFGWISGFLC
jgi:hypothetical protein